MAKIEEKLSTRSTTLAAMLMFVAVILMPATVSAEEKTELGDWEVHHIVLPTTFLTAEIAKANGIVRSKYNSMVNISVLDSTSKKAQNVSMKGTARNLLGNSKQLEFKTVRDGDAIYYLAVFSHAHKENFRFDITIQQGDTVETLQLKQIMYVD
ncbi:MAG: hypothetical protein ACI9O6_000880 [Glaciecola sp.]|jgi:hypothetical protein